MNADALVAATSPVLYWAGAKFYFVPETLARGRELGLRGMEFYTIGRGGPMGDVDASVITAAFGYFNPTLVAKFWNGARAKLTPQQGAHEYMEAMAAFGREKLTGLAGLDEFVESAEAINEAADADSLPLYAATKAQPLADDTPARAVQLMAYLRELRGSAHLLALRACGVNSRTAHFVKRPKDIELFGWTADDAPVIDDDVLRRMDEAEALTDRLIAPAYAVLDSTRAEAFASTLRAIGAAIS